MKAYFIRLNDNSMLSNDSMQSTRDKYQAIMTFEYATNRMTIVDGTIETIEIKLRPCNVSRMTFGFGDTYSHETVNGFIVHETKKYIWCCESNEDNTPHFSTMVKHKKENEGTIDYNTRDGYQLIK